MKKVLVTGFTPFGDFSVNSSQRMAERLNTTQIPNVDIRTAILPVVFSSAFETLKNELDTFKPEVVILLGLADKREKITLEKVAINLIHCEIPDNDGVSIQEKPIVEKGADAHFSTLNLIDMRASQTPFPVAMSFTAGTYLCNYVMYRTLDHFKGSNVRSGFIHLPHLKENEEKIFETLVTLIQKS